VRRFATLTLLSLTLGLTGPALLYAQDDAKKDAKPADDKKDDAAKPADDKKDGAAKPADGKKDEASKSGDAKPDEKETPLPSIPPDVEQKLEKARRAVAEAIVAAQDAGLVETTVNPPPILDVLITGRATDARQIKKRAGVSPEVFGAWFTGYGKLEGFTAQKDVRIVNPSDGLTELFTQRANVLERHIKAVRDAKGDDGNKKAGGEAKKKADDAPKDKGDDEAKKKADDAPKDKGGDEAKKKADDAPKDRGGDEK
jgi:hypothetical protein